MPAEIEIKLQDLVKVALGCNQLTNVNIAVLQSLIKILLKKLNCENETVSLNALEAQHLENMLKTANKSPIIFNDENIEIVSEKLERLYKLHECVNKMEEKLERHLEATQRKSNLAETVIDWENWSNHGCEHLCTSCDPENEVACQLLTNTDFIKKLLRRISAPIVERIFYFESKVEKLNDTFTNFIQRTEKEYLKIHLLEKCMSEIEKLRFIIKEQQAQFIGTMEEIQDMMDSKLDKIHVPALKKYISDNFLQIDKSINEIQNKQNCAQAAGIITEGLRCMSCGNDAVCSDVGAKATFLLPDMMPKKIKKAKHCGENSVLQNSKKHSTSTLNMGDGVINIKQSAPKCRGSADIIEFLEGFDGNLYRKG